MQMSWLLPTVIVMIIFIRAGLQHAIPGRIVLRSRRDALLRDPLPRQERLALRRMPQADYR